MKKQLWNLLCGNKSKKGFVFTLDSLIAVAVVFIILGAASGYVAKSENVGAKMQIARTGSDIVTLLENTNSFNSLNSATIENSMNVILPKNYNMRLNLECSNNDLVETASFIIGSSLPDKEFIGTGKRFFVLKNAVMNYCMVKYWVWKK